MGIIVGDNFNYQASKPLDSRAQFVSLTDMKAYPDASLYDGCIAYVTANKKNYQYDSNNTVDTTTGKWREFEAGGGGGGTSNYNDLSNKPQIAGTTLSGNVALSTLGLTSSVETQSDGSTTKSYVTRGEKYNWNTGSTWYGTCSTSASTTAKSVTLARGTLNFTAGAKIAVKFSYTNTASAPTLTINSTTKNIKYIDSDGNVSTPLIWWNAGDVVEFTYDGTQWLMQPTMQMLFSGQGTKMPRESIYSTSEKVVGCWTDGRPVYQKTIAVTTPTTITGTATNADFSVGATISTVVDFEGWFVRDGMYYKMFDGAPNTAQPANYMRLRVTSNALSTSSDRNKVRITNTSADWSGLSGYVTVKYTKTTDAANSFKYGDPNEYSTTEKIVGSWIDGKPLYQKTINFGALPNATTKSVNHGVSNFGILAGIKGTFWNSSKSSGAIPFAWPASLPGSGDNNVSCSVTPTQIIVATGADMSQYTNAYITLQYTKS